MHGGFSRKGDIDWLYVPRKLGERGLISVCYAIEHEKRNLASYVHHSEDVYMTLVAGTIRSLKNQERI